MKFDRNSLILFSFIPAILLGYFIHKYSHNVFLADEWDTPGVLLVKTLEKEVSFNDFVAQHNESRKIFPKLIYYGLAKTIGLNIKHVIFLRFVLAFFCFLILLRSLQKQENNSHIFLATIISLLIFSPTQALSHLTSIQIITIIPPFLIVLFYFLYPRVNRSFLVVLYVIFCLISTFSFANGMLLWVLLLPVFIPAIKGDRLWSQIVLLTAFTCFASTLFVYFSDYTRPAIHPSILEGFTHPLKSFRYFILWVGSPFANSFSDPALIGSIIGCASLILFSLILLNLNYAGKKNISFISELFKDPWFALVLYAIISGLVASLGRSGLGVAQALSPQYPSMAIWFYVGVIGLLSNIKNPKIITISNFSIYSLFTVTILSYPAGVEKMRMWGQRCEEGELTVKLLSLIPNNPLFNWNHNYGLYPAVNHPVKDKAIELSKAGLIDLTLFDNLILSRNLQNQTASAGGFITFNQGESSTEFRGWAMIPDKQRPADFIIICKEDPAGYEPITGLLLNEQRKDVSKELQNFEHNDDWGFRKIIYESNLNNIQVKAFAVDEETLSAYPLVNAY